MSVEESCSSRITLSMCCRSTTWKRWLLTSASSTASVMGRSPFPVIAPTATVWYGAMLISAGFMTGTRTETVPQAQRSAAANAKFFMVSFPRGLKRAAAKIGSTP